MDKGKFKALPFRKKVTYALKNYIWDAILGVILVLILCSWIKQDYIDGKPALGVEMINASTYSPQGEAFEPFLRETKCRNCENGVKVSKIFQLEGGPHGMKCDPGLLMFCTIQAGRTDMFFWNTKDMEQTLTKRVLIDLRDVLPPEIIQKHQDQLVYSDLMLRGGYPCGIMLENNGWVRGNQYYDSCSVGIAEDSQNKEAAAAFLCYILK